MSTKDEKVGPATTEGMLSMIRVIALAVLAFVFVLPPTQAEASDKDVSATSRDDGGNQGSRATPGTWFVSFYRAHISPVDGDRCPSVPSCSSYCNMAINKHGFLIGWMMTVDRLIHEGEAETAVSPTVLSEGKWKIYDPVENNDFWWYHRHKREGHE